MYTLVHSLAISLFLLITSYGNQNIHFKIIEFNKIRKLLTYLTHLRDSFTDIHTSIHTEGAQLNSRLL